MLEVYVLIPLVKSSMYAFVCKLELGDFFMCVQMKKSLLVPAYDLTQNAPRTVTFNHRDRLLVTKSAGGQLFFSNTWNVKKYITVVHGL